MAQTVYILGAHPLNGYSMRRYTALLTEAYQNLGYHAKVLQPTSRLSKWFKTRPTRKVAIYLEKLVLFPLNFWRIPRGAHIHVADHSDGIWLLHPKIRNGKAMLTCHDLFAINAAAGLIDEHYPKLLGRIYQHFIDRGIRHAGKIISVSDCTFKEVARRYPKIPSTVVHNPLDKGFLKALPPSTGGYALIVGTLGWRKRRDLAIDTWIHLSRETEIVLPLVMVGPQLTEAERLLLRDRNIELSQISVLSNLSEESLLRVYSEAGYLILASKYEGFAWPILEANAFGVPALCADEPILRETGVGNVFFNPKLEFNDWNSISRELITKRQSSDLIQRAQLFTHERFTDGMRNVMQSSAPS